MDWVAWSGLALAAVSLAWQVFNEATVRREAIGSRLKVDPRRSGDNLVLEISWADPHASSDFFAKVRLSKPRAALLAVAEEEWVNDTSGFVVGPRRRWTGRRLTGRSQRIDLLRSEAGFVGRVVVRGLDQPIDPITLRIGVINRASGRVAVRRTVYVAWAPH